MSTQTSNGRSSASDTSPLLLVGYQSAVRPALRSIGRPAFVLVGRGRALPACAEVAGAREVDLHGPEGPILDAARELLGDEAPAAVVALAERTVLAAAHLRVSFGLPGNAPTTALRCADKVVMKRAMDAAGVPVAPWCEVGPQTTAKELVEALGLPLVIKPRRDSGGRDQAKLADRAEVERALAELVPRAAPDYGWLAEGWIDGTEMSVEAFVREGVPVLVNPTEYYVPRHASILPAEIDSDVLRAVTEFTARALRAAAVERGITHLELFRTREGLVFGELASRPPGGRLMTLLERAWGFDPWEALLRLELGEAPTLPAAPQQVAGAWVLHPGAGLLAGLRGRKEARAVPGISRIALKVRPGDTIGERVGSGQDVGAVYAEGKTRNEVARALSSATDLLEFELSPVGKR